MTEKEMQDARNRLYTIENARERITRLMKELADVNKIAKAGKQFNVAVVLQNDDHYRRSTTIHINLSPGVVQQSLIYEIESERRKIVQCGGSL
jgi:hypothetical protein